ncbi:hypothetical protein RJT34_19974 [Clitoria ternatea]|uniref:Uncharacterized protein n=1 Tax=Clitoria ternatea TaxID=43366 RepID=A0AAN9P4I9_CLITE
MTFNEKTLCFIIFTCFLYLAKPSNLMEDTLLQGHQLAATNHLISSSGLYTLRFFQLDGSEDNKFYLGISAHKYYIWVANRDNPIHDGPGVLTIDEFGNLKIFSSTTTFMLHSVETASNKSVSATLLDTGNLVLHELNTNGSVKRVLWQSFDYPTDTLVPGMRLSYDKLTGHNWSITARRSYMTLWSGSFSLSLDPKTNQLVSRWRGTIVWSSGQWENGRFRNWNSSEFSFTYFSNEKETYYEYASVSGHIIMDPLGILNASGISYSRVDGEIPRGCSMPSAAKCREDDDLYLPSWTSFGEMSRKGFIFDESENMTLSDCWMKCLNNCSCEAYTFANQDLTGCEIWSRGAAHFFQIDTAIGRPIFFFRSGTKATGKHRRIWIVGAMVGVILLIITSMTCFIMFWRKQKERDFGMARIFRLTGCEEKTNRVVGTYGYMSPEYAMRGVISTKIDVYSFGVLLLEIVSGKKNNSDYPLNLIGYAWQLWNQGEALKLLDIALNGPCPNIQVLRCIHIGLLCIQDRARDRPIILYLIRNGHVQPHLLRLFKMPSCLQLTVVH